MSRLLKLSVFLLVILAGLIFHLKNGQFVVIDYYIGILELPFSASIVFTLIVGVVLGVLAGLPARVKLKRENARLQKQVAVTEREVNALRVIPVKDDL